MHDVLEVEETSAAGVTTTPATTSCARPKMHRAIWQWTPIVGW